MNLTLKETQNEPTKKNTVLKTISFLFFLTKTPRAVEEEGEEQVTASRRSGDAFGKLPCWTVAILVVCVWIHPPNSAQLPQPE